jgi:hypothetical protein
MLLKMFKALESAFIVPHQNFTDALELTISPYLKAMSIILVILIFAAIMECMGTKTHIKRKRKMLRLVGRTLIVISSLYITWFAFYLGSIPLEKWPLDLAYHEYTVIKGCFGVIILAFLTIVIIVLFLEIYSFFKKRVKKDVKNGIYSKIYVLVKIMIVLGLIPWSIIATHSSMSYFGLSVVVMKPSLIILMIFIAILLFMPDKKEYTKKGL